MLRVGSELIRIEVDELTPTITPTADAVGPACARVQTKHRATPSTRGHRRHPSRWRSAPVPVGAAPIAAERPIASPAVRRRAWESGIDLATVAPSGAGGRVLQADLDAAMAMRPTPVPRPMPAENAGPRHELPVVDECAGSARHRPAPPHCPADAGGQASHPTLQLCGRGGRDRFGAPARPPQCHARCRSRQAHAAALRDARHRARAARLSANQCPV